MKSKRDIFVKSTFLFQTLWRFQAAVEDIPKQHEGKSLLQCFFLISLDLQMCIEDITKDQ